MPGSVEIQGNGTGVELGAEVTVEAVAVAEILDKCASESEANGLIFAGFRSHFSGAGLAEVRMSAALLGMGCIDA